MRTLFYLRRGNGQQLPVPTFFVCWLHSFLGAGLVMLAANALHWLRFRNFEPGEFLIGPVATFFLLLHLHFYDRNLGLAERIRLEAIGEMSGQIKVSLDHLVGHFTAQESGEDLTVAREASEQVLRVLNVALPEVSRELQLFRTRDRQRAMRSNLNNAAMILSNLHELPDEVARKAAVTSSRKIIGETLELINRD